MRVRVFACLLAGASGGFASEEAFDFSPSVLVDPPARAAESLLEAKIEPTKYERRLQDAFAAETWEQGFSLAARLPVDEAFSLRQEFRTGLQSETVLGQELAATYRDALALLEKTSAELRASEALRLAVSVQQQWLATNSVPFAEILTYGAEAALRPMKATVLKLQAEWQERDEFSASASAQETYRLALEQELFPKRLTARAGVSFAHFADGLVAERETFARKLETALQWTPLAQTALTLGVELADQDALRADATAELYAVKLQQQLFPGGKVELQAGYEQRVQETLDALSRSGAWNLGAQSDFTLRDDWAAGFGVRYRQRSESPLLAPVDEVSLSLSIKGRF